MPPTVKLKVIQRVVIIFRATEPDDAG